MANDEGFKVMIAAFKECGKEFEMRIPLPIYEAMVAACEQDGETPIFTGRCPDCQECDPFLKLLKEAAIPTVGGLSRSFSRHHDHGEVAQAGVLPA
jgi:hypothetical protein